ncbi:pirin family protein [Corynebacterium kalidii]|uniref:Pirin family protein n=1 Tax=Corynebacterium kalidii TaxID=2931982 RepID=A0A9X2B0Y8_9CORY|nr:pirin family protein [Corynebacterium kalidii]MCJ7857429.1 pirin family protein [Corynebacterium kalidii]
MATTVIPSGDRARWPGSDIVSRQSFPATGSTRMTDYAFGLLLIHNDDIVEPGEGFDMHQHADVEIVSWIVHGRLRHRDSSGTQTVLGPGQAEAITAGRGVRHAETNAAGFTSTDTVRVIQMWLPTDEAGVDPSHAVADLDDALDAASAAGEFVTVAAGGPHPGADPDAALRIRTSGARLRAARPVPGRPVTTDPARYAHVFVVSGAVRLHTPEAHDLQEGDAARVVDGGALRIEALADGRTDGQDRAEVLVWEMDRSVTTTPRLPASSRSSRSSHRTVSR